MALNLNLNLAKSNLAIDRLVDLTPEPAKAKVVREGYQVPLVPLDERKSSFFLENLQQIPIRFEPRVVSQSVPAGTKVLPGTAIDLVLAPTSTIPFDIFELPHRALVGRNLNTLDTLLDDNTVRQTLLKYNSAAEVPPTDKALLTQAFLSKADISLDEANADTGFDAAFKSARGAAAFR